MKIIIFRTALKERKYHIIYFNRNKNNRPNVTSDASLIVEYRSLNVVGKTFVTGNYLLLRNCIYFNHMQLENIAIENMETLVLSLTKMTMCSIHPDYQGRVKVDLRKNIS